MKIKIFILLILLSCVNIVHAVELTEAGVLLRSYHFDRDKDYNEANYGLVLTIDKQYQLIGFKNSHYDATFAAGRKFYWEPTKHVELSIVIALVYGYGLTDDFTVTDEDEAGGKTLLPWLLPTFTYKYNDFTINTHFLGSGLAWSIGYRL